MPRSDPSPDGDAGSTKDAQLALAGDAAGPRVWRACLPCRRKKVKCDGKQPCYNCSSRNQDCEVPESNDNASASRHYAATFEARCQQMAALCDRLEDLTGRLAQSVDSLGGESSAPAALMTDKAQADLLQAAHVLRSMPELRSAVHDPQRQLVLTPLVDPSPRDARNPDRHAEHMSDLGDDELDSASDTLEEPLAQDERESRGVGALIRDSYGHLRFVGGSSNHMLIEAAHSVSPNTTGHGPSPMTDGGSARETREQVEIPIFVRGKIWPELPFLPRPEQLPRPPQYVADMLVRLYFDQLHYTFPVLFRPHFMQRYRQMFRAGPDAAATPQTSAADRRFLMVFFAICACASSLLPPTSDSAFPGIEYYERALLLYYASTGEASLERVQCLALLAMCAAGWNTLTQSWTLAGQAVRAAQDIGIHLNNRLILSSPPVARHLSRSDLLDQQISRRVWWCAYILDKTTSICLGRPMAAHDEDCDWEMPLDMSDEDLERQFRPSAPRDRPPPPPQGSPSTTGFLAFARLCRISGKVQQLGTPHRLRELTSPVPGRSERFLARVSAYDAALQRWLDTLPDSIRFSANAAARDVGGGQDLVMCVVSFIVHAGSLLNLHRCFIGHSSHVTTTTATSSPTGVDPADCVAQCKSAARSCINAAEMVRDLVPPSHYLAICVHYLTLSGVVLLRLPPEGPQAEIIADIEKCAGFLKDLEQRWSGAARSRAIVEKLLADYRAAPTSQEFQAPSMQQGTMQAQDAGGPSGKRPFNVFDEQPSLELGEDDFYLNQMLGSELFAFENADAGLLGPWGRL